MKKILIFAVVLLFGIPEISAQTKSIKNTPALTEASPESVGISSERLDKIDKMCEKADGFSHIRRLKF